VDADRAVVELYRAHYRSLVRLTALLVHDLAAAEVIVQDSFVAMHGSWPRLRDRDKGLSYLRQSVVSRSRAVITLRAVIDRESLKPPADMPSDEHGAMSVLDRSAVIAALRRLPARQREALVLRFYADMSDAQISEVMQISIAGVKVYTATAMATVRAALGTEH
jgi:RNA polymerase sigma factor (sigma-70 family)